MAEQKKYFGIIHWPRVWMVLPPDCLTGKYVPMSVDPATLADEVWSGGSTMPIKIRRDGTILFDMSIYRSGELAPFDFILPSFGTELQKDVSLLDEERCDVINTYLYCLYSKTRELQRRTLVKTSVRANKLVLDIDGLLNAKQNTFTSVLTLAAYPSQYSQGLPSSFDWRVQTHPGNCVYSETLDQTSVFFEKILNLSDSREVIRLCSLLIRAYAEVEHHNYRLSLVQSAMVCEFLLKTICSSAGAGSDTDSFFKYIKYLLGNGHSIPVCKACRRDIKKAGRECLSEKEDYAGDDLIICANRVRCVRNDWLHGHNRVTNYRATESLRVAEALLKTQYDLEFFAGISNVHGMW